MERSKHLIIILLIGLGYNSVTASNKLAIYNAYVSNNMAYWNSVLHNMEQQTTQNTAHLVDLVNFEYGYIGYCLGHDKHKEAREHLAKAENYLDKLEKAKYSASNINAYRAAFYGFHIGLNPMKAPVIGFKSLEAAELALKLDAQNPFAYLQYANIQFYMPAVFGGSKSVAIDYFKKAQILMEKNGTQNDWNYLSLLVSIAQAYTHLNNFEQAKTYYQKILNIEPNFVWVKTELYPQLLTKMKTQNG